MAPRRHLRGLGAVLALALALQSGCTPAAASAPRAVPASAHPFAPHVAEAAHRFGIPELWIWRVMHAESRGNARAVSPAGAMGAMQIMPATWAMLTARHRLGDDPFEVRANILAGAAYLRQMWDRYGDIRLMLAAYNAGPGRADAYASGRRGLPAETIAYVAAIAPELGVPGRTGAPSSAPSVAPSWRDAALFAARPTRAEGAAAIGAKPARDEEGDEVLGASPTASTPAQSLFVPLSGRGE